MAMQAGMRISASGDGERQEQVANDERERAKRLSGPADPRLCHFQAGKPPSYPSLKFGCVHDDRRADPCTLQRQYKNGGVGEVVGRRNMLHALP